MNRELKSLNFSNSFLYETEEEDSIEHLSTHNRFIPFYTLFNSKVYKVRDKKVILYGRLFDFNNSYDTLTKNRFLSHLLHKRGLKFAYSYKIKISTNEEPIEEFESIVVGKGYVLDSYGIPLLMLGVESDYINEIDIEKPITSKFKLFIDEERLLKVRHKKIYSLIKNNYLPLIKEDGIDIISTKNMNEWLYKPKPMLPHFETLEERVEYLKSLNTIFETIESEEETSENANEETDALLEGVESDLRVELGMQEEDTNQDDLSDDREPDRLEEQSEEGREIVAPNLPF